MPTNVLPTRRDVLLNGGRLTVAGVAVLAGVGTLSFSGAARAADPANPAKDVDTINGALKIEHQLIAGYQLGADSGLLKQPALNIALLFQSHHKAHRDALSSAIQKIGGTPINANTSADYGKELNMATVKTQNDMLELALKLELGAANAYIGILPLFEDREMSKICGRILADESMHWTALASTLAHPLPASAMFFGS